MRFSRKWWFLAVKAIICQPWQLFPLKQQKIIHEFVMADVRLVFVELGCQYANKMGTD
jgi:hypothetical protein